LFTFFSNSIWVIDSGASDHITPDLSLLHNVRKVQAMCYITMPNGKQAQVKHVGSVCLTAGLILQDVLHISDFQFNLLSISKLTKQFSANVIFTPHACFLQGPTMKTVSLGNQDIGLYFLQHNSQLSQATLTSHLDTSRASSIACFSDSELWHFRLGHLAVE